jgi:hypothetical protein
VSAPPRHIGRMSRTSMPAPDLPPPSARPVPRPSRGDGWNILADIEVFIFAVEAELEAMDRERVGVHRRGCKPDLALRRRVVGLIWMLTFGGMQWRIAGLLSGIPFTTLHTSFARWSRLGLWRRLGQRLALDWRLACGDEVLPSAVVVDAARSAPPRAPGREASMAASWSRASSSLWPATSTVRCSISSCIRPIRMTGRASCRRCRGWRRLASREICSAIAGSRARPSPQRRWSTTSTSQSRPVARGTGAFCRTASAGW